MAVQSFPVKIPIQERIDMIISSAAPKYAVVYNLSKYGLRPDEISKITLVLQSYHWLT